jgi:hypothetical protein
VKPLFLEGVIVCKDYSDFLEQSLPMNLSYFDRLVVVTHPNDKRTQQVCAKFSVDCVTTEAMHEHGDAFNKGRAINIGLGHLRGLDWILHLDADVVLPHRFRDLLVRAQLQREKLYGADRVNIFGWNAWQKFKQSGMLVPYHKDRYFVHPPDDLGARIVHDEHGYCPIGYFQLWHTSQHKKYPIHTGTAEHSDVLFAIQWSRANRVLLPEVVVYHLDSMFGPSPMGQNWGGRKSPIFGPDGGALINGLDPYGGKAVKLSDHPV